MPIFGSTSPSAERPEMPARPSRRVPSLFFGPALGFEVAEVCRRISALTEMAHGVQRVVDPAALHLRAVKFIADRVIVGRRAETAFELLERCAGSNARQCDWFAVALSQFVGSA